MGTGRIVRREGRRTRDGLLIFRRDWRITEYSMILRRLALGTLLVSISATALEIGPPVAFAPRRGVSQEQVSISRLSERTLITFEERRADGISSAVVHQVEANMLIRLGPETNEVASSSHAQRNPAICESAVAWLENAPGDETSLWWQALFYVSPTESFRPRGTAERVAAVAPRTRLLVTAEHVFHIFIWTAPDGRLKAIDRSLVARIGYDPSPYYVTSDTAVNPAAPGWSRDETALLAYNHPLADGRFSVRAASFSRRHPGAAIDIAPAGASAPHVVFNGIDFVVYWSMDSGGTFAQRVSTAGGLTIKLGEVVRISDGRLHGATDGPAETFVVVDEGFQFALLRLDGGLHVVEYVPFAARAVEGSSISVSSDDWTLPMLAYAEPSVDGTSRAVYRVVAERLTPKRRSVR